MKLVLMTLIFLIGSAQAEETAFDQLELLYNSARRGAELQDFQSEESNPLTCVSVKATQPDKLYSYAFLIVKTVIPARPGNGPLFPGTPEREVSKVVSKHVASKHYKNYRNIVEEQDFVIAIDFGLSDTPAKRWVRKTQDGWLAYKFQGHIGTDHKTLSYGYCWRGGENTFL